MISTIVNLLYTNSQLFIYFDCKICFHNTNRVLFPRRTKIDVQTPTTMSLSSFGKLGLLVPSMIASLCISGPNLPFHLFTPDGVVHRRSKVSRIVCVLQLESGLQLLRDTLSCNA